MKQIVTVTEVEGEGLDSLLGKRAFFMCANYFYIGKLTGVNASFVKLEDAEIVYDTNKEGKITQQGSLPSKTWYVQTSMIESYGAL